MKHVPTLDIGRFETDKRAFVSDIGAAYREFGFCGIGGHGIPPALIENAYRVFQEFFALPDAVKRKYHLAGTGGARGYTPFMVETAKDARYPDLKEFWHVGREIPRDSKYADVMAPNVWPDEVPGFQQYGYGLYRALDELGTRVLRALALHIDLPENYFDDKTNFGNSILRPIHYPPITQADVPNVRAGAHEDINFITLLVGASAAGLELLTREGTWLPITTQGDTIVVNIGDMLQRLTNHVYPSTTHRVVNPQGPDARKPRYSVPFFLHPNPDFLIETLPSCVSAERPDRYPQPILSHDYLMERLREIKLV
ncbi:MAG TPA: 2-oxoglutarate and iron-dependent oxygenase domain-containing protein [Candidatus Saccharimonadia bacterium]|nr:2-oxoglutarate and iron-dependent oxygenase domain-containing protein [Candidatus Saccharimonadia bacterium]